MKNSIRSHRIGLLRRKLMTRDEFEEHFGMVPPEELHLFRVKRWFGICDEVIRNNGGMLSARELYTEAIASLRVESN